MLDKTIAALRGANRALILALVLATGAGATATATTTAPATDNTKTTQAADAPAAAVLPIRLAPDQQANNVSGAVPLLSSPESFAATPSLEELEKGLTEQRCLAEAMYYEARGEGVNGEKAIAEVVFHRMRSTSFPHSVCGVVYQGAAVKHACQFSFACNGELQNPKTPGAWLRASRLAARILAGLVQLGDETGNAISFHAAGVQPDWGDRMVRTIQIGNHVFYRSASRSGPAS